MTVASAAPVMPNSGKIQSPKINSGSKAKLIPAATIMMMAGVLVSPVARMVALPTCGITTKTTPMYHRDMYCSISGITSGVAPSERKMGFIVSSPTTLKAATISRASSRLSVDRRCTLWRSPSPMALEITADAPTPSPRARLEMIITTGKVKLIAASSLVPSCPI